MRGGAQRPFVIYFRTNSEGPRFPGGGQPATDGVTAGRVERGTLCFILWCMFKDALIEHFRNPHNAGEMPDATATAEVTNPVCGDVMRLAVRVEDGRIAAARFKTQGCVAAIASSSVLTDLLGGKTPAEARKITPEQISSALGDLPPATFHAAQLCVDAVAALVAKLPR